MWVDNAGLTIHELLKILAPGIGYLPMNYWPKVVGVSKAPNTV